MNNNRKESKVRDLYLRVILFSQFIVCSLLYKLSLSLLIKSTTIYIQIDTQSIL